MDFVAYVWARCKVCGHSIREFTVKEKDFQNWKVMQLRKHLYCRRCRRNVKVDLERGGM